MTINIQDTDPVTLDGSITGTSELELAYDGDAFGDNDDLLLNELSSLNDAEVVVPDFLVGTVTHAMHVWDVDATGGLSKWSRGTSSSVSGSRAEMDNDILVVAVPPGVSVPSEPEPDGPPAPGTTQKKVKIKIGEQGTLPWAPTP
jgi:hypothetical protein